MYETIKKVELGKIMVEVGRKTCDVIGGIGIFSVMYGMIIAIFGLDPIARILAIIGLCMTAAWFCGHFIMSYLEVRIDRVMKSLAYRKEMRKLIEEQTK